MTLSLAQPMITYSYVLSSECEPLKTGGDDSRSCGAPTARRSRTRAANQKMATRSVSFGAGPPASAPGGAAMAADGGGGAGMPALQRPPRDTRVQTEDVTKVKGNDFEDYFLKRELLMGIFEKGFERPSPVQEEDPHAWQGATCWHAPKTARARRPHSIPCLEKTDPTKNHIQHSSSSQRASSRCRPVP